VKFSSIETALFQTIRPWAVACPNPRGDELTILVDFKQEFDKYKVNLIKIGLGKKFF
jgi:hypothetical protein